MAALQCDICGGSLTMDAGGEFASCESCGLKHDKRRMQQKVQEITGTVRIDGPVQVEGLANIENLLQKGFMEFEAGSGHDVGKTTFKRVLELDPNNVRAWIGLMLTDNHQYYYKKLKEKYPAISEQEKDMIDATQRKQELFNIYVEQGDAERAEFTANKIGQPKVTPVHLSQTVQNTQASPEESLRLINLLLKYFDCTNAKEMRSIARLSAGQNKDDIVKVLLNYSIITNDEETMKNMACCGNTHILDMLSGYEIVIRDSVSRGSNGSLCVNPHPLAYAVLHKNYEAVKLLLQKGANPNIKINLAYIGAKPDLITLLKFQKKRCYDEQICDLLKQHGAKSNWLF